MTFVLYESHPVLYESQLSVLLIQCMLTNCLTQRGQVSATYGLVVQLTGDPGEVVEIAFAEETTVFAANCTLSTAGALLYSLLASSSRRKRRLTNLYVRRRRSHRNSCTAGEVRHLLLIIIGTYNDCGFYA